MSAMLTCKFEKPIKTEGTMPGTRSNMDFLALNSKNSKVNCPIQPNFKLVQDFTPVNFGFRNVCPVFAVCLI